MSDDALTGPLPVDVSGGLPAGQPPQADRLRQLLAKAAEEQVNEQRAVSSVLADMRAQLVSLSDNVRQSASDAAVERLSGIVSTVVADVRTSTTLLGQRLEALSRRVEQVAADSAGPAEQTTVRLSALAGEVAEQSAALGRLQATVGEVATFPGALVALQNDVAGLHDRVAPLTEVRSTLGDLGARTTASLEALRPQLERLQGSVEASGVSPDAEKLRASIVDSLTTRLDRIESAADRPSVGPDAFASGISELRLALDGALGERMTSVDTNLSAIDHRLSLLGGRVAEVGDAAGGVPALATDLARLTSKVDDLQGLHERVATANEAIAAVRADPTPLRVTASLSDLREDIASVHDRLAKNTPPSVEDLSNAVSARVADRLVESLAPRLADVVLTRVSVALTHQLAESLAVRMRDETAELVRAVGGESERRILAHVDESLLALAEALLRRRRAGRTGLDASDLEHVEHGEHADLGLVAADDTDVTDAPEPFAEPEASEVAPHELAADDELPDEAPEEASDVAHEVDEQVADPVQEPEPPAEPAHEPAHEPAAELEPEVDLPEPLAESEPEQEPEPVTELEPSEPEPVEPVEPVVAGPTPSPFEVAALDESAPVEAEVAQEAVDHPADVHPADVHPADPAEPAELSAPAPRRRLEEVSSFAPPPQVSDTSRTRPVVRPPRSPLLEATPDLEDDDEGMPTPFARPRTAPPVTPRVSAPATPAPAAEPTETPQVAHDEDEHGTKRKPWWRPGG